MNASPQTDEELLAAFRSGDRSAFGELARRHERSLLGLAGGLLGVRRELACDAVQETWMRILRFADRFDQRSQLKTWMYRILMNRCRDLATLANGSMARAQSPDAPELAGALARQPVHLDERVDDVRAAVGRLSLDHRAIVLLCYHSGLTHEQAAEILEIRAGTLKSRLSAALAELRQTLAPEADK